jgi:phosphoribosylformylglycinamidine synthase
MIHNLTGGNVPRVDVPQAKRTFAALHRAIQNNLVRACHDMSEGGLAVAAAEMCFAGGLGAELYLNQVPSDLSQDEMPQQNTCLLFSESNSRFLCEVPRNKEKGFEQALEGVPCGKIGTVQSTAELNIQIESDGKHPAQTIARVKVDSLKKAWLTPLDW